MKMKMLNDKELEFVAGGHIPIISPGEGIPNDALKDDEKSDRSGGATGGW